MLVRMKTRIGGYRDGEPWPAPGGTIDVPAHEAHSLISNGYATLVPGELLEGELIDGTTGDVLAAGTEIEVTGDGSGAALPPADPDNPSEEREDDGSDWTFGDPTEDSDEEAAADRDEPAARDGDEEAAADEVAATATEISATVPTGARKSKQR